MKILHLIDDVTEEHIEVGSKMKENTVISRCVTYTQLSGAKCGKESFFSLDNSGCHLR